MMRFRFLICLILSVISGNCLATKPVVQVKDTSLCQNLGDFALDGITIKPTTKFGVKMVWRILSSPAATNPSNLLDEKSGTGIDWHFIFGTPAEDFYAGTYYLELKVTENLTGDWAADTAKIVVKLEPSIKITNPYPVCINWPPFELKDFVKVDGSAPQIDGVSNWFGITQGPKTGRITGSKFNPAIGAGVYTIKFSSVKSGCLQEDSFDLLVKQIPDLNNSAEITVCSGTVLDLSKTIISVSPNGGAFYSSGKFVSGNQFTATGTDTAALDGPYRIKLIYEYNFCADTSYTNVYVQNPENIQIKNAKPTFQFETEPLEIKVQSKFNSGLNFYKLKGSDGVFSKGGLGEDLYTAGTQDLVNHKAYIKVCSYLPLGVCPVSCDSFQIQYIGLGFKSIDSRTEIAVPALIYAGKSTGGEFLPRIPDCKSYSLKILNELGQIIFQTMNTGVAWKPETAEGNYFYQLEAETQSGKSIHQSGKILVLR